MKRFSIAIGLALFLGHSPLFSQKMLDALTREQLAQLNKGELVVISRDVPGGVWPELTVYTRVGAPVSAVGDVFLDYENAQKYIPNLVSAKVIAQPEPDVRDVEYTSKMPLLGNSTYSVRNWYEKGPDGITVRWKLIQSPMAEISDGSLRVEPTDSGCVLRYTNYVKPKSSIAIVAKGAAQSEVRKTVSAIKAEAERRAAQGS
jgi:hypothetical protein